MSKLVKFVGRPVIAVALVLVFLCGWKQAAAQTGTFKVLALYASRGEPDHIQFANQAIDFFTKLAAKENFVFDSSTDWNKLDPETLKQYQVVVWLNDFPSNDQQRAAFQQYMESGGAWFGFHVSGYNDAHMHWPWFVNFFGGSFEANNWPPLPAKLIIDDRTHPVTRHMPASFESPANEWYSWKPNPRLNPDIRVLATLSPENYPLGKKDTLVSGDIPVVWTNTKYKMVYMNMGHGSQIFASPVQNQMITDAVLWLGGRK